MLMQCGTGGFGILTHRSPSKDYTNMQLFAVTFN